MVTLENYLDSHYIHRSNWLRAAVLGANDGIISISSLAVGVATASHTNDPVILATVAGLAAGALSMAAGEYVSVSSQTDTEKADIEREKEELRTMHLGNGNLCWGWVFIWCECVANIIQALHSKISIY
jgi:VIT1/CCC1 family predicted Fe2+/Mn2+ transporter